MIQRIRSLYPLPILGGDLSAWIGAFLIAGLVRNEFEVLNLPWSRIFILAIASAALQVIIGFATRLYRNRWRTATFEEVAALGGSWLAAAIIVTGLNLLLDPRVPTSVVGFGSGLALMVMLSARFAWRLIREAENRPDPAGRTRVAVFGAGEGGTQAIKSMLSDPNSRFVPVAALDDDDRLRNRVISGVPVVGGREAVAGLSGRVDTLLVAMPSAEPELLEELATRAREAKLDIMVLPPTNQLLGMFASIEHARPLEITDLLGRDEVTIDADSVGSLLRDRTVLVTGAGGSIGSELCKQILTYEPGRLVMLDRDETALQAVQLTVKGHGLLDDPNLVLANIRDRDRVFEIFAEMKPDVVFHAAALKHLPLLESHPREGLLTNVFGTRNVLDAAKEHGVKTFVNVSTDKAANPSSVLGTTKRLAEAFTLQVGAHAPGEWLSVRFGNVIGSRGSVLPAFEKQIKAGGPVTVTHPDVTRYFMSIPEASRLVLQAGAIGSTGETLVLEMGEPMKIVDLAEKLIRHHNSDAAIVFTGLRPNEKLHEVLTHDGEVMTTREHSRIWHTDANVWLNDVDAVEELLSENPDVLAEKLMAVSEGLADAPGVVSSHTD